jgi:glycosyltransferase involved in cell wall biosynthesis
MRLSLRLIARDDEDMLPHCLESVSGAADEVVLVDTGSRDATLRIACEMGARVPQARYLDCLTVREQERVGSRLLYDGSERSMPRMSELHQGAGAHVSPYRTEGFNMPVLEATACRQLMICTAGGPTEDFVSATFAQRVEAGPAHVAREFTWDRVADRLIALLAQEEPTHLRSELDLRSRQTDHAS